MHVEDALSALELVERGPVVDVGSGGGSPGIPLAAARPGLRFDLLEATERKCAFLRAVAREFPNVAVVCARAEDHARGSGRDAYGTALARALAPAPVALEWMLPLVAVGGRAILFAGASGGDLEAVTMRLGAGPVETVPASGSERRRFLVVRKERPTPLEFPRRPGIARKRPLG